MFIQIYISPFTSHIVFNKSFLVNANFCLEPFWTFILNLRVAWQQIFGSSRGRKGWTKGLVELKHFYYCL